MCVQMVVSWTHQLMDLLRKQFIGLVVHTLHYHSLGPYQLTQIYDPLEFFSGGYTCESHTVKHMGCIALTCNMTPLLPCQNTVEPPYLQVIHYKTYCR
jgi:hypothetical protein